MLQASDRQLSAEEIYGQMLARGITTGIGSVYNAASELTSRGLLRREWSGSRKTLYSLRPSRQDEPSLKLVCTGCGRSVVLTDKRLHARLIDVARSAGVRLAGQTVNIQVECEHDLGTRMPPPSM